MSRSKEMVVVTEFASHDNLSVFEPRSGSDVLDISQLFSVARFLHLQAAPCDNMDGIPNYMSWESFMLPACISTSHARIHVHMC